MAGWKSRLSPFVTEMKTNWWSILVSKISRNFLSSPELRLWYRILSHTVSSQSGWDTIIEDSAPSLKFYL